MSSEEINELAEKLKNKPEDIDLMITLGLALASENRFREAEEIFKRAGDAGSSEGHYNLGVLYGMIFLKDMTYEELWEEVTDEEIWFEKAEIAYQTAIELDPNNFHAMRNLATLYAERNQKEDALALLAKILEKSPDDEYKEKIREQIKDIEAI
ncbi:tetratricopeptide repeat protein [candidate division WOR-3 bacterium]|nr:tetratricopeptide repeat protein [candidate division WOR-3 bacterium]